MVAARQFCTFYLDKLLFGVDLEGVQEVVRALDVTPIPLAPKVVRGIINLRGQIVTAIDLRGQLELEPRQAEEPPMNVVVRGEDGAVSLLVDHIGDVIEAEESSFERPPETLSPNVRSMIAGIHKLDGRLLHVLDIAKVCRMGEGAEAGITRA
ncbi:MAG: chemotaxis protein CheW [Candidatus Acidiferrales bacterium]